MKSVGASPAHGTNNIGTVSRRKLLSQNIGRLIVFDDLKCQLYVGMGLVEPAYYIPLNSLLIMSCACTKSHKPISNSSVESGGRVAVGLGVLVPAGGTGVGIINASHVGDGGDEDGNGDGDGDDWGIAFADWQDTIVIASNNEIIIEYFFIPSSYLCNTIRSQ